MHPETGANLCASRHQENNLFTVMAAQRSQTRTEEERRYNKSLNDWSRGKQLVLFPSNLNVSLDSASGNSHKVFINQYQKHIGYINTITD